MVRNLVLNLKKSRKLFMVLRNIQNINLNQDTSWATLDSRAKKAKADYDKVFNLLKIPSNLIYNLPDFVQING